jgi:predicted DNA-binding transcriptional regulator AlpA
MADQDSEQMKNKKEVAAMIGMSYRTTKQWIKDGRFPKPSKRVGRMEYWTVSQIRQWASSESVLGQTGAT